jgi:acetolactate synthase-1/2/3 large subunit
MIGMHGTVASNKAVQKADLLITLGARFSDRVTSRADKFAKNAAILQFDIDPAEINKNIPTTFHVTGDIKLTIERTLTCIRERNGDRKKPCLWADNIEKWKADAPKHKKKHDKHLHPRFIIEDTAKARAALPHGPDVIVATDVGQHQMWTAQFYPVNRPRAFLTSGGLGTMGFGLGAAVGAAFAAPHSPIVLFIGDGSFKMNCAELATVKDHDLAILVVIINNKALGMVRQWQNLFFEKRFSESVLGGPPDFVLLAKAYGHAGFRADCEESFLGALSQAVKRLGEGQCSVLDAVIDTDEFVLPMVPGGKPIDEQILQ